MDDSTGIEGYMGAFRQAFATPEHQPLYREGGEPGALLIHGLVGTPAEMRPLAERLHAAGWTVDVPLLPGHGVEIEQLFETHAEAWIDRARDALRAIQTAHSPVLVVGHSMGGAVALQILAEAAGKSVAGLILISPFVRMPFDNLLLRVLGPVLRLFVPVMHPFRHLDLEAEANREAMQKEIAAFIPDLDLEDSEVQAQIQQMAVPTRLLGELTALGRAARKAASRVTVPTLVLQGTDDEVVLFTHTRRLLAEIGGRVDYYEFGAAHNLVRTDGPAWDQVAAAVQAFSDRVRGASRPEGAPV